MRAFSSGVVLFPRTMSKYSASHGLPLFSGVRFSKYSRNDSTAVVYVTTPSTPPTTAESTWYTLSLKPQSSVAIHVFPVMFCRWASSRTAFARGRSQNSTITFVLRSRFSSRTIRVICAWLSRELMLKWNRWCCEMQMLNLRASWWNPFEEREGEEKERLYLMGVKYIREFKQREWCGFRTVGKPALALS